MKKIISICVCLCILCGCGSMRGLQRESSQNLHQTVNENDELYWNANKGHNNEVKMLKIDEHHAQIIIPVDYREQIEDIERIKTAPNLTQDEVEELHALGSCANCTLEQNHFTIDLTYEDDVAGTGLCAYMIVLSPILVPLSLVINGFSGPKEIYKDSCTKYKLQEHAPITISKPTSKLEERGVIEVEFNILPSNLNLHCDKKACSIIDENENFVNKIVINKKISVNQKHLDELIEENKKLKEEEAKRKAQEAKEMEKYRKLQAKECPALYRKIQVAQLARSGFGYNVDPIALTKVAQRFEELGCGFWYNEQLN